MPQYGFHKHGLVWFLVQERTHTLEPLTYHAKRRKDGDRLLVSLIRYTYRELHSIRLSTSAIEVHRSSLGRPYYELNYPRLLPHYDISLSYRNDIVVGAIAVNPGIRLGIDIEVVRPISHELRSAFLSFEEYASLGYLMQAGETVLAVCGWSIKESYLKAIGVGLRVHPRRVVISYNSNSQALTVLRADAQISPAHVAYARIFGHTVISAVVVMP